MRAALLRPIASFVGSGFRAGRRGARSRIAFTSVLVAGALSVLAGCGEDRGRPIPTAAAQDIVARLDEVERRVDARACNDVREDSLPALKQLVADLPSRVDDNVRATLEDGLDRLSELVVTECRRAPRPQPEPTPTPAPDPPSLPEPQPEAPSQPDTPSNPDGGGGNGDGGGGNDGGGSSGGGSTGGGGTGGGGSTGGDGDSGSVPPGGGTPGGGAGPGGGVVSPPTGGGQT